MTTGRINQVATQQNRAGRRAPRLCRLTGVRPRRGLARRTAGRNRAARRKGQRGSRQCQTHPRPPATAPVPEHHHRKGAPTTKTTTLPSTAALCHSGLHTRGPRTPGCTDSSGPSGGVNSRHPTDETLRTVRFSDRMQEIRKPHSRAAAKTSQEKVAEGSHRVGVRQGRDQTRGDELHMPVNQSMQASPQAPSPHSPPSQGHPTPHTTQAQYLTGSTSQARLRCRKPPTGGSPQDSIHRPLIQSVR